MATLGYIQITRLCNQKCRFCSNPERNAVISLDEAKRHILDLKNRGYDGIILTGGEPTLHPDLYDIIVFSKLQGIHVRMITNGQSLADREKVERLKSAGLDLIHVSIHSYKPDLQSFLSENPDSFENIMKTLENIRDTGIQVNINTTINHYNADHLDKTVRFLVERFPFLHHFVWNNLDPSMNRATQNPDVIPKLWEFEISLYKAMRFLDLTGRSFRVEKVPLCYMAEYAHCSTETRKIVKGEARIVHFLDERGFYEETRFIHNKGEVCSVCRVNEICAGLYDMGNHYDKKEIYPLFIDPEIIKKRIVKG